MSQTKIHIYCYGFNSEGLVTPLFAPELTSGHPEEAYFKLWQGIANNIPLPGNYTLTQQELPPLVNHHTPYQRGIILLFGMMKHLADPNTYQHLSNGRIRKISNRNGNMGLDDPPVSNFNFQPVITIAERDIMGLYEHPEEISNAIKYFPAPDPRFKFFDSSIWHRYVPMYSALAKINPSSPPPVPSAFFDRLLKTIELMGQYHRENLYTTNAARSALELQLRLLKESFIERFGTRGHYKAVTPFKFHSENRMEEATQELLDSFYLKFLKNLQPDILVNWRFLLVDDYAHSPISTFLPDPALECQWTKRKLIRHLLRELKSGITIDYPKAIHSGEQVEKDADGVPNAEASAKVDIIDTCLGPEHLLSRSYDILLLDYLLGRSGSTEYREFGHQFLQRLNQDAEHENLYQRGPFGRFWVFPISSFPFAMQDKLKQLGITNFNPWWHLAEGCDPISMPHLFRFKLFSFIKHQISEVLLTPKDLTHHIGKFDNYTYDPMLWTDILGAQINEILLKIRLLEERKDESPFAKSMCKKLSSEYKELLEGIKELADSFQEDMNFTQNSTNFNRIYLPWLRLKSISGRYRSVIDRIDSQFKKMNVFPYLERAEQIIELAITKNSKQLKLDRQNLHVLPEKIADAKHIESLSLRNNFLETIPPVLSTFEHLKHIDLSGNPISIFPPVLFDLGHQLQTINLEGTQLNLPFLYAKGREKVDEMLAMAQNSNPAAFLSWFTALEEKLDNWKIEEVINDLLNHSLLNLSRENFRELNIQLERFNSLVKDHRQQIIGHSKFKKERRMIWIALHDFIDEIKAEQ